MAKRQPRLGRRQRVDLVRQADEVDVGPVERDQLGERAPVREARLRLAVADLALPGAALLAVAARADERHGHALAGSPPPHAGADGLDDPGELVAGDVREAADVGVVADPAVPVRAAEPARVDADDRAEWRRSRIGTVSTVGTCPNAS